jgi:hypothetical protein
MRSEDLLEAAEQIRKAMKPLESVSFVIQVTATGRLLIDGPDAQTMPNIRIEEKDLQILGQMLEERKDFKDRGRTTQIPASGTHHSAYDPWAELRNFSARLGATEGTTTITIGPDGSRTVSAYRGAKEKVFHGHTSIGSGSFGSIEELEQWHQRRQGQAQTGVFHYPGRS